MMKKELRTAFLALVLFTALTGVAYPLLVTGLAQVIFPRQAHGSLIERGGRRIGSELVGQIFTGERYFWGRPSATAPSYNGGASSGSNLGPINPAFLEAVAARVASLRSAHPQETGPVPADLATASASGLDPHLSPAAAFYQVGRVAAARGLDPATVRRLVEEHVEGRQWGFLGEPRVNVLALNLSLDGEVGSR